MKIQIAEGKTVELESLHVIHSVDNNQAMEAQIPGLVAEYFGDRCPFVIAKSPYTSSWWTFVSCFRGDIPANDAPGESWYHSVLSICWFRHDLGESVRSMAIQSLAEIDWMRDARSYDFWSDDGLRSISHSEE